MKLTNFIKRTTISLYLVLALVFAWGYHWIGTSYYKKDGNNPVSQLYIHKGEVKEDLLINDVIINIFQENGVDANYSNLDSLMNEVKMFWEQYADSALAN